MGWGRLGEFAFLSNLVELAFLVMVSFWGHLGRLVFGVFCSRQHLYFSDEARLGLCEEDVQWWKSNNYCSAFLGSSVVSLNSKEKREKRDCVM